jgi:hypothetical protein
VALAALDSRRSTTPRSPPRSTAKPRFAGLSPLRGPCLRGRIGRRAVVAVLTHIPKFDVPLLEAALRCEAGYTGVKWGAERAERVLRPLLAGPFSLPSAGVVGWVPASRALLAFHGGTPFGGFVSAWRLVSGWRVACVPRRNTVGGFVSAWRVVSASRLTCVDGFASAPRGPRHRTTSTGAGREVRWRARGCGVREGTAASFITLDRRGQAGGVALGASMMRPLACRNLHTECSLGLGRAPLGLGG